jgi:hypothetical protein
LQAEDLNKYLLSTPSAYAREVPRGAEHVNFDRPLIQMIKSNSYLLIGHRRIKFFIVHTHN